ncbi:MAG TPA: DUF349 domain-containing protein [Prolixibacteraceae bacterium]|nr:DUF349 domain-containing protein [Prolixibacteraceae bacterium]
MEPKDLKNSEELKSALSTGIESSNEPVLSSEVDDPQEVELEVAAPAVELTPETADLPADTFPELPEMPNGTEVAEPEIEIPEIDVPEVENPETEEAGGLPEPEPAEEEASAPEQPAVAEIELQAEEAAAPEPVETEVSEVTQQPVAEAETPEEVATDETEVPEQEEAPKNPEEEEEELEDEELEESDEERPVKQDLPDYNVYSQLELVNVLRSLLETDSDEDIKDNIDAIKAAFYRKAKAYAEEMKKKFIDEGGVEEEYVPEEDPYEQDIRDLLKKYRQVRFEQSKKLDAEKETNLKRKYEVIEAIKNLIHNEESINKTFHEFRELQKQWYEIGQVPQAKMKDLWDTYHFHVENFYDYIKINKELRDLDLKKNLELKISLCEKAEELLLEPSVMRAFNSLQKFHEQWREIGPVPRDKKDEIWERFKVTTAKINQKYQEFLDKRKSEQKKNLDAKTALCEKAEEISQLTLDSHKDWDDKSRELVELQKVWRTIGFAPKKDNNRIYDRFRTACDTFFNRKREFYSKNKEAQQSNLQMKLELCMEAEKLKDNDDWKKTTQQFIDLQKRWKEVGPVPRKHSDALWKRFRAACDYFFDKKSGHFSGIDEEQVENLRLKEQLIAEVEAFKPEEDVAQALKVLRDFQRRWTEIGHVPIREKDAVQNRFRESINKHFDALKMDDSKRNFINFREKISSMSETSRGLSKVRMEREKYMIKLKQLENDLTLLDNNIGFFANSKNAQALIADVNQKIKDTREKIEYLKDKIRIIDELDKSEY